MAYPKSPILFLLLSLSILGSTQCKLVPMHALGSAHKDNGYSSAYSMVVLGQEGAGKTDLYARIVEKNAGGKGEDVEFNSIVMSRRKIDVINFRAGQSSEVTAMRAVSAADLALIFVSIGQNQEGRKAEEEALRTAYTAGIKVIVVAINTQDEQNCEEAYYDLQRRLKEQINKLWKKDVNVRFALVNTKANSNIWSDFKNADWYNEQTLMQQVLSILMNLDIEIEWSFLTFPIFSKGSTSSSSLFGIVTRGFIEQEVDYHLCPQSIKPVVNVVKAPIMKTQGEAIRGEYANIELEGIDPSDSSLSKYSYLTSDYFCPGTTTLMISANFYDTFRPRNIDLYAVQAYFGGFHAQLTFEGSCFDKECNEIDVSTKLEPGIWVTARIVAETAFPFEEIMKARNSILFRENGQTIGRGTILRALNK